LINLYPITRAIRAVPIFVPIIMAISPPVDIIGEFCELGELGVVFEGEDDNRLLLSGTSGDIILLYNVIKFKFFKRK